MDNRFMIIKDLVTQACARLKKDGIEIEDSIVASLVENLHSSGSSIEQIREQVLEAEHNYRLNHVSKETGDKTPSKLEVARNLQSLSVRHKGITIHIQDIDLMKIACSNDFYELQMAMKSINHISLPPVEEKESFSEYRQRVFSSYLGSLISREDYIRDNKKELLGKLQYLFNSGTLTDDDKTMIDGILAEKQGASHGEIVSALRDVFGVEKTREMLGVIWSSNPIEKEGVKGTSVEFYRTLSDQIGCCYDSVTIDEECKYGRVHLQDGTFEGKRLRKSLDYAKSIGKSVRLNALMFYMDCPEELYNMDVSVTSKMIARDKLYRYVDSVTQVIAEYPGVVRSIDVFNEILNRHPMVEEDTPYKVRGEITQNAEAEDFDNIKSGWMKHLTVEDICVIMCKARENLPNVDFMYNDDHLTDPEKIPATIELIREIQRYGDRMGVKLIDSIGTQMHIDNDVSKEDIRNMFLSLSSLGLPIEVTEFDLAMTSGVEGLSDEEIEVLRQKKINEVFEVVEELRDKCRIRGFTIWSKTDSQNFRVTLANEIANKTRGKFISSLHGGAFTEEMVPKSAKYAGALRKQNFNYHGHTRRCGHGSVNVPDEYYVLAARNQGISRIGFSDHVAWDTLEFWQQGEKMHISEVDEYISSIRKLQCDNPDMQILCGFEAEYDPSKKGYLSELRQKCDYMILGQHYVQHGFGTVPKNVEYPLAYAEMVCEAMRTGIFDIVAHPDLFMKERGRFDPESEEYKTFIRNAEKASRMICETAKEMGIPLELNVRGAMETKRPHEDKEWDYPHSLFWKIAAETGNDVVYSADAHDPMHLLRIDEDRELVESRIDISGLKFVSNDYDPVLARKSNLTLQEAYGETLMSSETYETCMIRMIMSGVQIGDGDNAYEKIGEALTSWDEKFAGHLDSRLDKITTDDKMTPEAKELGVQRAHETHTARMRALARAQMSLSEAYEMGCSTKEEFVSMVGHLTEEKTATNPSSIERATASIEAFRESKNASKSDSVVKTESVAEKPKTFVYKPADTGSGSSSNGSDGGFASSLNLLLVIGMLVLFGVIVSFMIR